jgi:dTDP-4-dehydrorhamnose reductase
MRWLITGASGQLGGYLLRHLSSLGEPVTAWSGSSRGERFGVPLHPVDLADPDAVAARFHDARPDVILHAGALARVDECYRDPDRARRVNTEASARLAELASRSGTRLVLVSTDLVFGGERGGYVEDDPPRPLSVYGRTKADAEAAVLAFPQTAVARVSLLFGPTLAGRPGFFDGLIAALRTGRPINLFADEWRTPLSLDAAARALVELARSDVTGLLHLGGPERISRLEMGLRLAEHLDVSPEPIVSTSRDTTPGAEPRPRDVSLDSSRWRGLFPGLPWPTNSEALATLVPG